MVFKDFSALRCRFADGSSPLSKRVDWLFLHNSRRDLSEKLSKLLPNLAGLIGVVLGNARNTAPGAVRLEPEAVLPGNGVEAALLSGGRHAGREDRRVLNGISRGLADCFASGGLGVEGAALGVAVADIDGRDGGAVVRQLGVGEGGEDCKSDEGEGLHLFKIDN